ncbi:HAD family hydrolase [Spongisporangium articulatum]|uniref:HAD family hydrolase n=1 Tax=Spongisporangium articulatum TaxID=3362603 RepID=A0ABW8AJ37_9ACTN
MTRVAMWSGPRNISTAMLRSFGARSDTVVVDEPMYAYYLARTGLQHPGRDEVLAAQPTEWADVVAGLLAPLPPGVTVQYVKHMTHHLLTRPDEEWFDACRHAYLIRDPAKVVASYAQVRDEPTLADLGFAQQVAIWREHPGPVVDADALLADPRGALAALCEALEIPFQESMLSWAPGPRDTDGVWAKYWYAGVESSTGFAAPRTGATVVPERLRHLIDEARPYYEELAAQRLV